MGTLLIFLIDSQQKLKIAQHVIIWDKLSSETSGNGHNSPDKNVTGKVFLSEYEIPISLLLPSKYGHFPRQLLQNTIITVWLL